MARQVPQEPSPRTLLIRRIVVLTVLIAIIWGLWAGVSSIIGWVSGHFGGSKPAAGSSTQQTPGVPTDCAKSSVSVLAVVGDGAKPQTAFAAAAKPKFWFTITNNGSVACNFAIGTDVQNFTVTSGAETIWTNANCLATPAPYTMLLQPGVTQTAQPITWERVRSSSTGCDVKSGQATTAGGGASYHLLVTVNGVKSNDVQFILN